MIETALRPRPRRGAAMIVAITMIGLVAAALVLVGRLTVLDSKRSADERTATQLRIMLLAGQDWFLGNMDKSQPGENVVPLPPTLADGKLTCDLVPAETGDRLQVIVRASMFGRSESQTLIFTRSGKAWTLLKAELQPMRRD